jgi:O-antigen/teichoic acid export membrane protein
LLGYSQEKITIVYILGLALVLDAFTSMFISIFQAFERMDYPSLGKVLHGTALLASTLFILHQRLNIIAFAIAYLFASAIELIYSLIVSAKKFMLPKLKIDASFSRWLIKESLAFWLTSIIGVIYFRADIIILSLMKGDTIVGWYNASRQLINALGFIHMSFLAALFPITSRFYISSAESLRFAFEKSFKYLLMLALPISVGTVLLADKFIFLIYGSEYNPSIIVLQIIIWAEMLIFINAVLSNLMFSINRQSLIAKLNLFAFAFNTFLNLLLIPNYSYIGASIALVASELFSVLYLFRYLEATEYRMSKKVFVNITSKISLASLVMGIFIWIFKDLNLGILIFLSIIVYLLVFITIKGFDEADLNLINKLLHKIKGSETL